MNEMIYRYDGTFEGFLCCVFDSYVNKEPPAAFQDEAHLVQTLFPVRWVGTDPRHARRILASLEKIDPWARELVVKGFLTCAEDREMILYRFIHALYDVGKPLLRQLSDDAVLPLLKAVRHLDGEVHLLKGFTRFSDFEGTLAGEIRPKNRVLPLLPEPLLRQDVQRDLPALRPHPPGSPGPSAGQMGHPPAGGLPHGGPLGGGGPVPPPLETVLRHHRDPGAPQSQAAPNPHAQAVLGHHDGVSGGGPFSGGD